ncbi:MAG TPA: M14 family metallopeptidase [Stellaceae bacterium]|nr:M14 family metallopeptidase [Stellaceae bacterium]
MSVGAHFAADYATARRLFCDAAAGAGARLESHVNPAATGPAGELLATDLAWLGPAEAAHLLLTISGTHGVEGHCGSGIQVASLVDSDAQPLPPDTALLCLHAINPYGFAWSRRVNEDNVDLNRNFVDHARPLPRNDGYDELADAICPTLWDDASRAAAGLRLAAYRERHGAAALQKAVTGGQYTHPDGVFYGGAGATWSRRLALVLAAKHLARARRVAVIDYHTGLGPWGHGEKIVLHRPASAALERARGWYGDDVTSTALGTSASSDVVGDLISGLAAALPAVEFTNMALEYGVRSVAETIDAIRADNWLHHHGTLESALGREIKAQIRAAFYDGSEAWQALVLEQAIDAQRRALRGLAG